MFENILEMFNSDNVELKENILSKSKKMGISLNDDELDGLTANLSFVETMAKTVDDSNSGMDETIITALQNLEGSREMNKLLDKGIELEYTDGTKEIIKNK